MNFLHVRQLLQVYIHSYWIINIESYREKVITSNEDIFFHSGLKIKWCKITTLTGNDTDKGTSAQCQAAIWDVPSWMDTSVLFLHMDLEKCLHCPALHFFYSELFREENYMSQIYVLDVLSLALQIHFQKLQKKLKIKQSNRIWGNPILGLKLFSGNSFRETALLNDVWITYCTLKYSLEN